MPKLHDLPERSFAIAVPAVEVPQEATYDWASARLEALGFVRWKENQTFRRSELNYLKTRSEEHTTVDRFSLWAHPAGMIVTMDSYRQSQLNSVRAYAEYDAGYGQEAAHRAMSGAYQTSNYAATNDGATRYHVQLDGFRQGWCLEDALRQTQAKARLVPFDQWSTNGWLLYLRPELLVDYTQHPEWAGLREEHVPDAALLETAEDELLAHPPIPGLGALMRPHLMSSDRRAVHQANYDFFPVEGALNYFRDAVGAAMRYPKAPVRQRLAQWIDAAHPVTGWSVAQWRKNLEAHPVSEGRTNGLSALLHTLVSFGTDRTTKEAFPQPNPEKVLTLLRTLDAKVLARWCSQPDALGYSLPMLLAKEALVAETVPDSMRLRDRHGGIPAAWFLEASQILLERVPADAWTLCTDQRSLQGMRWEAERAHGTGLYQGAQRQAVTRFEAVVEQWRQAGLAVDGQPLRVHLPVDSDRGQTEYRCIRCEAGWTIDELRRQWHAAGHLSDRSETWLAELSAHALAQEMAGALEGAVSAAAPVRRLRL